MNSDAARKQPEAAESAVEMVIETRARDLVEGFKVRRALPSRGRRMVGPFIFLDQIGPEILRAGKGLVPSKSPGLSGTFVFLGAGRLDHIVPTENTERLTVMLREAGAEVELF